MAQSHKSYNYSRSHRLLEIVGIAGLFILLAYVAVRLVMGVSTMSQGLAVLGTITVGYFLTDFISGFVHWAGDTLGSETMPIIGATFVKPFRFHHVDQKDITRHDFIETNGNNCILSLLLMLHVAILMPRSPGFFFYYGALMFSIALFTLGTNQFHKWAHAEPETLSPVVRGLQRAGLILSPEHHTTHHTAPYETYYCITHGMLNPLLARIRFFRHAERFFQTVWPSLLYLDERVKFEAAKRAAEAPAPTAQAG
ncbi:MAG TPA: fatty acid desaturase CarF family protein [Polyangia bacterium]|nr:fatty acid desaturase CarF family protein [Polyangia bacterium]